MNKKLSGFTIVEMMAVIVVILILGTLGYGTFVEQRQGATDKVRQITAEQIILSISEAKRYAPVGKKFVVHGSSVDSESVFSSQQEVLDLIKDSSIKIPSTGPNNCFILADIATLNEPVVRKGFIVFTANAKGDDIIVAGSTSLGGANTIDNVNKQALLDYVAPQSPGCPTTDLFGAVAFSSHFGYGTFPMVIE